MIGLVRRLVRRVTPADRLRRGVLTLVAGTTAAHAIVVLGSPILTRLYTPQDVGAFSLAASLIALLLTITCLSYDWAIPLPAEDAHAADVLVLALLVNAAMAVVLGVALVTVGPTVSAALGIAWLDTSLFLLIAAAQFFGGVTAAFTGWAIRAGLFGGLAWARVSQNGAMVVGQVAFGVASAGAGGLLAADVFGRIVGSARLATVAFANGRGLFRAATMRGIAGAARRYRRFPLFSSGSAFINTLGLQAPLLFVVAVFGPGVGGQYALAVRIAALPVTLVASSVGQVFLSEAATVAREDPGRLRSLFLRATLSLVRVGVVPLVLVMVASPLAFGVIFGTAWQEAGVFAALLAPMYFLSLVASPTGGVLDVLERQELHMVREVSRLLIIGVAMLAIVIGDVSEGVAVAMLSGAGCLIYLMYGLISWSAILGQRAPKGHRNLTP